MRQTLLRILGATALVALLNLGPSPLPVEGHERTAPGRVVMDMVIWAVPPAPAGHCIELEPGHLTVTVVTAGELGPVKPVGFALYGYRGTDPAVNLDLLIGSRTPESSVVPLKGGLYCYTVTNLVPVEPSASMAELTTYGQEVGVQMVIGP